MDCLDIESFRSRYSDITVTAVPARSQAEEEQQYFFKNQPNPIHLQNVRLEWFDVG